MEIPIKIQLCIIWKILCKLGYEYKDVYKDLFTNKHKQQKVVQNCKVFFNKIKKLKPDIIELDKVSIMKSKVYRWDCVVKITIDD